MHTFFFNIYLFLLKILEYCATTVNSHTTEMEFSRNRTEILLNAVILLNSEKLTHNDPFTIPLISLTYEGIIRI